MSEGDWLYTNKINQQKAEIERLREAAKVAIEERNLRLSECRNETIEECVRVIEQWENDDTPRSYLDLITAIRRLKDRP